VTFCLTSEHGLQPFTPKAVSTALKAEVGLEYSSAQFCICEKAPR
jgi:hypothetical protein